MTVLGKVNGFSVAEHARKAQAAMAYRELRCQPWLNVGFERRPHSHFTVGNIEHLIGAGRMRKARRLTAEVVRQVVVFER